MDAKQRTGFARAADTAGRFILLHPIITLVVVGMIAFTITAKRNVAAEEAYRLSPAGKAKAAREQQEVADDALITLAQTLVQGRLRDPDSAQFMGVHVVRKNKVEGVCGFVNAKNAFGGMAGNDRFAVIDMTPVLGSSGLAALRQVNGFCEAT